MGNRTSKEIVRKNNLEITFNIDIAPASVEGTKVQVDVEGTLEISINGRIIFKEEGILLVELAVYLSKWLRDIDKNKIRNLYYESMDCEEHPILEFVEITNDCWNVSSVWQEFANMDYLDLGELCNAAKIYIEKLLQELMNKFNLDVSAFVL